MTAAKMTGRLATAGGQAGHGGPADGHHGPHRQIDTAGDHQRHAEGRAGPPAQRLRMSMRLPNSRPS